MAKNSKKNKETINLKDKETLQGEIGSPSGVSLNSIVSSHEYNNALKGKNGIKEYIKMLYGDGTVQALAMAVRLPILSTNWWIQSASDDKRDVEIAEFVEEQLFHGMTVTWSALLQEILDYPFLGVYPFEIVWKFLEPGVVGIHKLGPRLPDTILDWQTEDKQDGIQQMTSAGAKSIPMEKLVIFVSNKKGNNWWGLSILRGAFKHWYMKDKLYLIDAIASERQGLGIPYAKQMFNSSDADERKIKNILKNLRVNEKAYALVPNGVEIGFMDTKGSEIKNVMPSIEHHDRQIIKSGLAQFLNLGQSATGSFALSKDQSDLFLMSLESIATTVKDALNMYLIKKLVDFNFNDVEKYPELVSAPIARIDFGKLVEALSKAVQIEAVTVDDTLEPYLREAMDLPEKSEVEDIDVTLADDIFDEAEASFMEAEDSLGVTEEGEVEIPEDDKQASETLDAIFGALKGPLSEETKKKISEALKKYWARKGKGSGSSKSKTKNSPAIKEKRAKIAELKKEFRKFKREQKKKMLEKAAKGEKMDKKKVAKMRLDIFEKQEKLMDKVDKIKAEIETLRASELLADYDSFVLRDVVAELKERIDNQLDA